MHTSSLSSRHTYKLRPKHTHTHTPMNKKIMCILRNAHTKTHTHKHTHTHTGTTDPPTIPSFHSWWETQSDESFFLSWIKLKASVNAHTRTIMRTHTHVHAHTHAPCLLEWGQSFISRIEHWRRQMLQAAYTPPSIVTPTPSLVLPSGSPPSPCSRDN